MTLHFFLIFNALKMKLEQYEKFTTEIAIKCECVHTNLINVKMSEKMH